MAQRTANLHHNVAIPSVSITIVGAIEGTDIGETLSGSSADDLIKGNAGDDTLYGGSGSDIVIGGEGNDILHADSNDTLIGGAGDDVFYESSGGNIITISRNDGHDVIYGSRGENNRIRFDDTISPHELWMQKVGNDLQIKILGEDQTILVKNLFNGFNGYGSVQHYVQASNGLIELIGTDRGYHKITETSWPGAFLAKEAYLNDAAVRLGTWWNFEPEGNDNYLTDAQLLDRNLEIHNITPSYYANNTAPFDHGWLLTADHNYEFLRDGGLQSDNAVDIVAGTISDDTLVLGGGNNYAYGYIGNDTITGSATIISHDRLYGDSGDDIIDGGAGDDLIVGGLGEDSLTGSDGADTIFGGSDNDILSGGAGIDVLYGGYGADTFVFEAASAFTSSDNIQDFKLSENDKFDISDLLQGYDPLTDAITDFVQITESGTNSYLNVDADGSADNFVQVAYIYNETGLTDEEALETSGNLIAA